VCTALAHGARTDARMETPSIGHGDHRLSIADGHHRRRRLAIVDRRSSSAERERRSRSLGACVKRLLWAQ